MKIENSIHIAAAPEKVYAFFENIEANYLKWHPDHRVFKSQHFRFPYQLLMK